VGLVLDFAGSIDFERIGIDGPIFRYEPCVEMIVAIAQTLRGANSRGVYPRSAFRIGVTVRFCSSICNTCHGWSLLGIAATRVFPSSNTMIGWHRWFRNFRRVGARTTDRRHWS